MSSNPYADYGLTGRVSTTTAKKGSNPYADYGLRTQADAAKQQQQLRQSQATKPKLTPDQQVQQATADGKKVGEEAKKRAEQQQPKQSLFSKVKSVGKDLVVGAGHIAAKAENTTLAGLGAVAGTAAAAGQDRLGYKDASQSTRNKTVRTVNSLLDKGIDNQGGYLTSKQSSAHASLKDERQLGKNVAKGVTDITPFVIPGAKGGSLISKVTRDAVANGIVGAGGTAAQEKLAGQKLDAKEIAKGAAVNAAFAVGAHGVTAGGKGIIGKFKGKDVSAKPEVPTTTHTTPQPGDVIQPTKPELDPNTGKALHDTMANVHQPKAVADAEAAQKAATEASAKQSEQAAKDVAKATEATKKIDQQLEVYDAKLKDAKDGELSNVDQVKVKQLKEQKAELSKQIEDNTNLADIAQRDTNGRVEGDEQTNLEQSQADPIERAKAEAELAKTDPALAGKSTVSQSAGQLFMDAQKAGKPITMEEARIRASSAAPVATPTKSLPDAAKPEPGKPAIKPGEVSFSKNTTKEPKLVDNPPLKPFETAHMETVGGYTHSTHMEQEYADMLREQERSVKGGEMIKNDDGTYRRTSEHSKFYRDYYKEYGRAPSKDAYLAEAQRQLASGKAAYGASEDYKILLERENRPIPTMDVKTSPIKPKLEVKHTEGVSRVYERLQAEHPDALPGEAKYDKIKLQAQAEKAVKLVESDKNKAYRIAMGHETSGDLTATSANIALAEKALQDGNTSLYAQLVKNRSLRLTRAGQEIVSEKGSVTDNSASRYVKELISVRLGKLGKDHTIGIEKIDKHITGIKSQGIARIDKEVSRAQRKISGKQLDLSAAQKLIDSLAC